MSKHSLRDTQLSPLSLLSFTDTDVPLCPAGREPSFVSLGVPLHIIFELFEKVGLIALNFSHVLTSYLGAALMQLNYRHTPEV